MSQPTPVQFDSPSSKLSDWTCVGSGTYSLDDMYIGALHLSQPCNSKADVPRSWKVKFVAVACVAAGLCLLILVISEISRWQAFLSGLSAHGPCGNNTVAISKSPSSRWKAEIVEADCGATTDFSRSLVLTDLGRSDNVVGRLPVAIAEGRGLRRVEWKSDSTLVVYYDRSDAKFFKQESRHGDVTIHYIRNGTN